MGRSSLQRYKEYIGICGMTHVCTSPDYLQSNGETERRPRSVKSECIRPATPFSLEDAQRVVRKFVKVQNSQWLHSGIGYIKPEDKLEGGGRSSLRGGNAGRLKHVKHAPAGDNRFILRDFRSLFLRAPK